MTSSALPPAPSQLAELASAFCSRQGVEQQRAGRYAQDLLQRADEDVLDAAMHWARTGEMLDRPKVCGRTPASMAKTFIPSQVFSGLVVLRLDPARGERLLGHGSRQNSRAWPGSGGRWGSRASRWGVGRGDEEDAGRTRDREEVEYRHPATQR